jgi:hypothetical protein
MTFEAAGSLAMMLTIAAGVVDATAADEFVVFVVVGTSVLDIIYSTATQAWDGERLFHQTLRLLLLQHSRNRV